MSNVIIDDDIIEEFGNQVVTDTETMEEVVRTYIHLLEEIKDRAIIEGNTAKAFENFIETAKVFKGLFENCGNTAQATCTNLVVDMDDADEDLY